MLFGRRNRIFCACRHLGGGGRLLRNLSDNYAHSGASLSGQNAGHNASGSATNLSAEEQEKALHDAGVLSGNLNLDPENDPVVWVTDNGFEIKSHDVAVSSGTTTVSTVAYKYVTLGSWNWIIIGYSTKSLTQGTGHVSVATPDNYNRNTCTTWLDGALPKLVSDSTDAGNAIKSAVQAQSTNFYNTSSFTYKLKTIFTNAAADPANEIPVGCVLCLCAGTTGESSFNDAKDISYYPTGELKTAMTSVYNSIKTAANNQIQLTPLTTYGYNGSSYTTYPHSEYLFPLAYGISGENFCVETYLDTDAKCDINATWWMRSGRSLSVDRAASVYTDGSLNRYSYYVYGSCGVRPAFVLKIT